MFFASLPFADEAGSDVEVCGEDGLAGLFAGAQGADLFGGHLLDGSEAEGIEVAHSFQVQSTVPVEVGGRLVKRGKQLSAEFPWHSLPPV